MPKQGHFFHAAGNQFTDFGDNLLDGAAPLGSARLGDNAKCAVHVAPLHDRHERRRLSWSDFLMADRGLRSCFFFDVDDRKSRVVHRAIPFSLQGISHVIGNAVKFLRADDKIDMRQVFQQRASTRLRHATKETKNDVRSLARYATEHSHFTERLLVGHIPDTTRVQQHHVCLQLVFSGFVTTGNKRMRDLLRVAFVHLAAIGFNEKLGHRRAK